MPKDADLGWHLKYGEYFFQNHKILRDNIFSEEMPNFKFANHSWLSDLLIYLVFNTGGFFGLAVFSSTVLTLIFYFFSKAANLTLLQEAFIFPLLLLFEAPLFRSSFRSQFLSFLATGILLYLLSRNDKKSLLFIPPLFLIWANVHGQFIMGLGLLLLWIILKLTSDFFKDQKSLFKNVVAMKDYSKLIYDAKIFGIIFLLSILAISANPFRVDLIAIYNEVFRQTKNPLQQYIVEWSAVEDYSLFWWYLYVWLFLIGIGSLIIIYKKKLWDYSFYIFISFILLFLSFPIRRYIWVTFLISIPLIKPFFDLIPQKIFLRNILINLMIILLIVYISVIKIPDLIKIKWDWQDYCYHRSCSKASAEFLQSYTNYSRLFSDYNWGGWLIWNYPKIKPLIDGRMPFWEESGYSAFKNYIGIENNIKDIDQTKYDLVYISPFKPVALRLLKLVEEGKWEILYQDSRAFIFKRL